MTDESADDYFANAEQRFMDAINNFLDIAKEISELEKEMNQLEEGAARKGTGRYIYKHHHHHHEGRIQIDLINLPNAHLLTEKWPAHAQEETDPHMPQTVSHP
eukprot:GEMP01100797.1.p1 GENE.GEMP01100797.1~~GEMP01100797.1.p1  ORF type:complete len:103 (+),score=12.43 GEMP01100797.1:460-768(+)